MSGVTQREVRTVILKGFTRDELRTLLKDDFDVTLDRIVSEAANDEKAAQFTVDYFDRHSRVCELVAAIAKERPHVTEAQELYRRCAASLLNVSYAPAGLRQIVPVRDTGLERTLNEALGFIDFERWSQLSVKMAARVCRVELNNDEGTMGTGFLVGPDVLLTNYHVVEKVINGSHPAEKVCFRFDFRTAPDGAPMEGLITRLTDPNNRVKWLLSHSPYATAEAQGFPDQPVGDGELDYALVRLSERVGEPDSASNEIRRGWIYLPAAPPALAGLPALFILQHPKRAPLMMAVETNPQVKVLHNGRRVRYSVNTEAGSSGAPVFDKDWSLVALHHYGDPDFFAPKFNQGIPIDRIRGHLSDAARDCLGGRCL